MKIRKQCCSICNSLNITQQICFMIDPNDVPKEIKLDGTEIWDDWYWCDNCEDDCKPVTIEIEAN